MQTLAEPCINEELARLNRVIEANREKIRSNIQIEAEQRVEIKKLKFKIATLEGQKHRDLLLMRTEIGKDAVAEILRDDPEATSGFASFERQDNDVVPCDAWRVSDEQDRDWIVRLSVEPARGRYEACLAWWCELKE